MVAWLWDTVIDVLLTEQTIKAWMQRIIVTKEEYFFLLLFQTFSWLKYGLTQMVPWQIITLGTITNNTSIGNWTVKVNIWRILFTFSTFTIISIWQVDTLGSIQTRCAWTFIDVYLAHFTTKACKKKKTPHNGKTGRRKYIVTLWSSTININKHGDIGRVPAGHSQTKRLTWSRHLPWFRQGELKHSFTSISQWVPPNPKITTRNY